MRIVVAVAVLSATLSAVSPASAAAPAPMVVVEAHGLALQPGQTVDGTAKLPLQEGQQITLISPTGKIVKLHGPSDQPPMGEAAGDSPDVSAALKALLTQKMARTNQVGVVRGLAAEAIPPEPWLVDVSRAGNRCLPENSRIVVWRPEAASVADFVMAPSDRSWQARATWPAGVDRMEMTIDLPLPKRSTYVVKVDGHAAGITLIALPSTLTNDAMRVAWMEETGCGAQATALLQTAVKTAGQGDR